MFCPNCGNEYTPENKFCPSCGFNLGNISQPQQINPPVQQNIPQQNYQQQSYPQQSYPQQNYPQQNYQQPYPQQNYPQQMNNMQQGYYGNYNMQAAPKKSGAGLAIGLIIGLLVVVGAVVAVLFIFVLNGGPKQDIIGTWKYDSGGGTVTFSDNGKGTLSGYGVSIDFEYEISANNDLTLTKYGSSVTYSYDASAKTSSKNKWYIEGDKLYMDGDTYTRQGSSGGSGNSSADGTSQASTLNNTCKTVYAGVVAGTITNSDSKFYWAPKPGAAASARKNAAAGVTVENAMSYSGLSTDVSSMVYVTSSHSSKYSKGTILYNGDPAITDYSLSVSPLSSSTTLGTLYE